MDTGLQSILKIFYVGIPKMNKDSMQSELVRFGWGLIGHCLIFDLDVENEQNNEEQTNKRTKRTNKDCSQVPRGSTSRHFHLFFDPPLFFLANFLTTDAEMKTKFTPRYSFCLT